MEHTLQPGDSCLDCLQLGLKHRLRPFYISPDEQIVKCESETCLFPYGDDVSSSSDSEEQPLPSPKRELPIEAPQSQTGEEDDSAQLIEDILKQSGFADATCNFELSVPSPSTPIEDKPILCDNVILVHEVKKKVPPIEVRSVETVMAPSLKKQEALKASAGASSGEDVPKARISRYFDVINAQKTSAPPVLRVKKPYQKKKRGGSTTDVPPANSSTAAPRSASGGAYPGAPSAAGGGGRTFALAALLKQLKTPKP